MSGLIVTDNDRERALGCCIGGALRHGGGCIRDDSRRNLRLAHLRKETFNTGQELDRLVRQGLAHLRHQSIVNLLVRQVHAALAQTIQSELHGQAQAVEGVLLGPGATEICGESNLGGGPDGFGVNQGAVVVEENGGGEGVRSRHLLSLPVYF